jgi:hypothetical protein
MINRSRRCRMGIPTAMALVAGLALPGCSHKAGPPAAAGPSANPAAANDQKIVDGMEKMHARALKAPGGATEASDFAFHVTLLYNQGVAKRRDLPPTLLDEAVKCLDEAREANPDGAADLLARKGELLIAADKKEAGVGALRESISARPNLRAFKPLIRHYGEQKLAAEAEALCKKSLPAMKTEENRYVVLDECLKGSGSAATEVGLRWASPKDVSFYKNRKKEVEARLAAANKAKAKEEEGAKK